MHLSSCFLHQDPREYFDSQQANALKALGDSGAGARPVSCNLRTEEAYNSLSEHISEIKAAGFSDPVVNPDVAVKV